MVTFETSEGTLALPDTLVSAIIRHAEREADFAAGVLKELGFDKLRLPAAFLLEFAALMELWFWDWQGLRPYLPEGVPSFDEAKKNLWDRAAKGITEFEGVNSTPLSYLLMQVWVEHFAWDARDHFDADVIVGQADEDQFVDLMARFLWENRHQIECAIAEGGIQQ